MTSEPAPDSTLCWRPTEAGEAVSDRAFEGGVFGQLRNLVKGCEAWAVTDGALQVYVSAPRLAKERVEAKVRLNTGPS